MSVHPSREGYMSYSDFIAAASLVVQVAQEAVDEPDVVSRHPEVVDTVASLAGRSELSDLFGENSHDPDAFVTALAEGLRPYVEIPLEDPQIVESISVLAAVLQPILVKESQTAHA
jgi:esterase/lipase superfamily enzyme